MVNIQIILREELLKIQESALLSKVGNSTILVNTNHSLNELINYPDVSFHAEPTKIEISEKILEHLKAINWQSIQILDSDENDGVSCTRIKVQIPLRTFSSEAKNINESINNALKIIICLRNTQNPEIKLNKIDISISESLQRIGLGGKIYRAIIEEFGHLYSATNFVHNKPVINKIWDKLFNDSSLECLENELGKMCTIKNNPYKKDLEQIFK